jgi:lysophospholipase L1-like esterase
MHRSWFKYKSVVAALLGIFSLSSCKTKQYTWNTESEYYKLPVYNDHVKAFKKVKLPPNTAKLFIGDSMTEGFQLEKFFTDPNVVNMGISGDFTSGVYRRLDLVKKLQPKQVYVMIGINDILKKVPQQQIVENYGNIIKRIREYAPNAEVFIQSNLPTLNMGGTSETNKAVVKQVLDLNMFLQGQCIAYRITFVNLYPQFTTANQELNANYSNDGLHLNEQGYAVWASAIRQWVEREN